MHRPHLSWGFPSFGLQAARMSLHMVKVLVKRSSAEATVDRFDIAQQAYWVTLRDAPIGR